MIFRHKKTRIWAITSIGITVLLTTVTILACTTFESLLSMVLGGKTPILDESIQPIYTSAYSSKEEVLEAGNALNLEIEAEGAVLLINEGNALPISADCKVSVFGKNSVNLLISGSGAGSANPDGASTLFDGLKAAGISYNETLKAFYESSASGPGRTGAPALTGGAGSSPTLATGETPVSAYTKEVKDSLKEYADAAIIVLSRFGGESWDVPRFQDTANGGIEGRHYLQLDQNEYDLFDMVTNRFDTVIVLLNTTTPFQCDFLDDYNNVASDPRIDAVLWIGGPGHTGAEVIGKLLTGEINPSGRTADLYAKDFTKDPTWQNFGDNSQVNDGAEGSAFLENGTPLPGKFLITYEEGIYLGYRYYETRGYEERQKDAGSTWYEDQVRFPFGYGLSYTSFSQTIDSVEGEFSGPDGSMQVTITSENVGDVAGKDVLELYVTLPYYEGGIEKSYVQLVDFAKTPLLSPGEKYSVTFTVEAYDLASYDYNDANGNGFQGYELEAGEYLFRAGKNSHEYYDTKAVYLEKELSFPLDPKTGFTVENRYTTGDFMDLQYRLEDVEVELPDGTTVTRKGMSRTDFEGTFPKPMTRAEREILTWEIESEKDALNDFSHNNTRIQNAAVFMTKGTGASVTLRDLAGAPYLDPRWDDLMNQVTFQEMLDLVNNGDYKTVAIPSIDKNLTNDSDGPLGFVNFMAGLQEHYTGNTQFATEFVIASTWNRDLAYRMGKIIGETGLYGDVDGNGLPYTGWYAPAVNLHRSPFSGRNYEYYSEDPVLTGKMAVNTLNGARRGGVVPEVKHFALNDQETNRSGVSTYCTEQAFRELYLKAFEIAVKADDMLSETAKEDGLTAYLPATGIMSSFNRVGTRFTGGDYRLMTEILRLEWGFEGLVISDYKTDNSYMNSRQMLYAGNDLILTSLEPLKWKDASETDVQDVMILREATKNILYAMVNSNSLNVKILGYRMEWWKMALIILDILAVAGMAAWGIKVTKRKQEEG